jgi:hypothetical protein
LVTANDLMGDRSPLEAGAMSAKRPKHSQSFEHLPFLKTDTGDGISPRFSLVHGRAARARYLPEAPKMSAVISFGCEIRETWLDLSSTVRAPMRAAMKRWSSGLIVRSSLETA